MKCLKVLSVLGLAAIVGGCVETQTRNSAAVSTEPMTIDPAMRARNWDLTMALYANGDTSASSTGFAYSPRPDYDGWKMFFIEPGVYALNVVTLPYSMYKERDGVTSAGVQLPASYTAVPPLPPSSETAPSVPADTGNKVMVVPATQP